MEYVAIPWQDTKRDNRDSNQLTVNLGLFVIHILAGNSHCLGWNYPDLVEEKLTPLPCCHDEVNIMTEMPRREKNPSCDEPGGSRSSALQSLLAPSSKKRKRPEEAEDCISWSFNTSFQVPDQVRFQPSGFLSKQG